MPHGDVEYTLCLPEFHRFLRGNGHIVLTTTTRPGDEGVQPQPTPSTYRSRVQSLAIRRGAVAVAIVALVGIAVALLWTRQVTVPVTSERKCLRRN